MLNQPSITVAYIVVSQGGERTYDYAARFVGSWLTNPPGARVNLIAVCNGGALRNELACLFAPMKLAAGSFEFFHRPNDPGKDVSAYQEVADTVATDMMVCLGESCHAHRPGWLQPIVEAWQTFGEGMYGFLSSNLVRPHLNTSAFACAPSHLINYPRVKNQADRYNCEHGKTSLWRTLHAKHIPTALVTWDGIWAPGEWRNGENIMWRGDQSNSLLFTNHHDRWFAADPETRFRWSAGADSLLEAK